MVSYKAEICNLNERYNLLDYMRTDLSKNKSVNLCEKIQGIVRLQNYGQRNGIGFLTNDKESAQFINEIVRQDLIPTDAVNEVNEINYIAEVRA